MPVGNYKYQSSKRYPQKPIKCQPTYEAAAEKMSSVTLSSLIEYSNLMATFPFVGTEEIA